MFWRLQRTIQSIILLLHRFFVIFFFKINLYIHVKRKHFDLFLDTDIGKIQVEINSYYSDYIPVRNTSYICNTYTSYTSRGDKYDPNINIIQINFSYGLKKDKLFSKYYIKIKYIV